MIISNVDRCNRKWKSIVIMRQIISIGIMVWYVHVDIYILWYCFFVLWFVFCFVMTIRERFSCFVFNDFLFFWDTILTKESLYHRYIMRYVYVLTVTQIFKILWAHDIFKIKIMSKNIKNLPSNNHRFLKNSKINNNETFWITKDLNKI